MRRVPKASNPYICVTYVENIVRSPGSQNRHKNERLLAPEAHVL